MSNLDANHDNNNNTSTQQQPERKRGRPKGSKINKEKRSPDAPKLGRPVKSPEKLQSMPKDEYERKLSADRSRAYYHRKHPDSRKNILSRLNDLEERANLNTPEQTLIDVQ